MPYRFAFSRSSRHDVFNFHPQYGYMSTTNRLIDTLKKAVEFIDADRPFALTQTLSTTGSTPQKIAVKTLIEANGNILGTIGGGLVEAHSQRRAIEACQTGHPVIFDFHLDDPYARDAGPICGGSMRILIDPTIAHHRDCFIQIINALQNRQRGVLLTYLNHSSPVQITYHWYSDENLPSDIDFPAPDVLVSCLTDQVPRLLKENSPNLREAQEVLVEPTLPTPLLIIIGGGHISQALAHLAHLNGFEITVIDDRGEFTDPARFPQGTIICCGNIPKEVAAFPIDKESYIAIINRGHKQDAETLEVCLHAPAAYIGMIGSKRKVALLRKHFLESNLARPEQFDRVYAPMGLDIGAVTVPEIATSIIAQLITVRRKDPGQHRQGKE